MSRGANVDIFMLYTFREVDERIRERGKIVESREEIVPIYTPKKGSMEYYKLEFFEFLEGIMIVREELKEKGYKMNAVDVFPEPRYEGRPYEYFHVIYSIFQDGKLVKDREKIKDIIKEITGISLPLFHAPPLHPEISEVYTIRSNFESI